MYITNEGNITVQDSIRFQHSPYLVQCRTVSINMLQHIKADNDIERVLYEGLESKVTLHRDTFTRNNIQNYPGGFIEARQNFLIARSPLSPNVKDSSLYFYTPRQFDIKKRSTGALSAPYPFQE